MPDWVALLSGTNGQLMVLAVSIGTVLAAVGAFVSLVFAFAKNDSCKHVGEKVEKLTEAVHLSVKSNNRTNELLAEGQKQANDILLSHLNLNAQRRPIEQPRHFRSQP